MNFLSSCLCSLRIPEGILEFGGNLIEVIQPGTMVDTAQIKVRFEPVESHTIEVGSCKQYFGGIGGELPWLQSSIHAYLCEKGIHIASFARESFRTISYVLQIMMMYCGSRRSSLVHLGT